MKEIVGKCVIQLTPYWYRGPKRTKEMKNSTDLTRCKTYVELFCICVTAISSMSTTSIFYLNRSHEVFSWVNLVWLPEKYLALFGDLIGLQRYAMKMVRSEPRRIMEAHLDYFHVSVTNGLFNWKKVNSDIETIRHRRLQLNCLKTLETYFKLTDTETVLDTERRGLRNQFKGLLD